MAGGIRSVNSASSTVCGVDSRFRGNDQRLEWIPIPNDIITRLPQRLPQELDFRLFEG
jgi:hypothetical protein